MPGSCRSWSWTETVVNLTQSVIPRDGGGGGDDRVSPRRLRRAPDSPLPSPRAREAQLSESAATCCAASLDGCLIATGMRVSSAPLLPESSPASRMQGLHPLFIG